MSPKAEGAGLVIADYGAGNLRSVVKAFEAIGSAPRVTSDPLVVTEASALVVPGVGAAGQIMGALRRLGLDAAISSYISSGRPFLGVCMGMQVLMQGSDEDGGQDCLGVFKGRVRRFETDLKVPHMGWNSVRQIEPHPMWNGIPDESYFYFVHSYFVAADDVGIVSGQAEYGVPFPAAVARKNVFGTQFHPEKSGAYGLRLYRNFVKWAAERP